MIIKKTAMLVLCLFLVICPDLVAEQPPALTLQDSSAVDAVIDRYVDSKILPFVYARLEDRDGRVIYEHVATNGELMGGMTVDGDTWLRIWSMSKLVTISIVMDLVEDGVLSLSDRVVSYIPEFKELRVAVSASGEDLSLIEDKQSACPLETEPVKYGMTVLDLVNHRAGFYYPTTGIDCLDALAMEANLPAAENSDDLIGRMAKLPLINQPGTTHYYGTGITVLGLVAERASGKNLRELVVERLTGPLQIQGLQYGLPEGSELPPRFTGKDGEVRRFTENDRLIFGTELPDYDPDHELYLGGEGMIATADAYADFARMLLQRGQLNGYRYLEAATVDDMIAPHTQLDSPYGYNGYNFWISNGTLADGDTGPAPLWIGGGYEGTHFWIDPKREFVGVIATQSFNIPEKGWGLNDAFRKAVYEEIDAPSE